MTKNPMRRELSQMRREATPLERAVIAEALSVSGNDEELKSFFRDLFSHGCVSGMVSGLIYYHDTLAFFKKHCEEILGLWEDLSAEAGTIAPDTFPSYNWFAWFGFEETARKVAERLALEI